MGLEVTTYTGDADLLGKTVDDLQTDVTIESDSISGILKYVDNYTGFSGDPDLQYGNYLAIHAEVPEVDGVTITAKFNTEAVLDADGICVVRVDDNEKKLIVTASKEGCEDVVKTFDLTDLVLEEELVN